MSEGEEKPVCEVCGKEAIGIQSLGCCADTVCWDHAEPALRDAKPGEMIVAEFCCYHRFGASSREGGQG